MNPERARELLGGLATGILTPEERQTLFEAALHDQALFNEVADELEFAAFLQSPETRAQLANRIPEEVEPARRRWWALRPAWLALSGVLAASAVLFVAVWNHESALRPAGGSVEVTVPATPPPPAVVTAAATSASPKTDTTEAKPKTAATAGKPKAALADKRVEAAPGGRIATNTPSPAQPRFSQQARGGGFSMTPRPAVPAPPPAIAPEADRKDSPVAAETMRATPSPPTPPAAPASPMEARNGAAPSLPPPAPSPARATASLEGTVHDASGAAVGRATIEIVNSATNATSRTISDASGRFVFQSLPPGGPYTLIAQAQGFRPEARSGITLAANQPARIDLPLQVGAAASTVQIMATAATLARQENKRAADRTSNPTQQVAVLDFVNAPAQGQSGQQAADQLSRQLLDSGQVRVIDREKVQQAWQSQQSQSQSQSQSQAGTGRPPNAKQIAAFARSIGADAVIVGTVQAGAPSNGPDSARDQANANVAVTAEVIDTKKARSMGRVAVSGASLQGVTNQLGLALESQLAAPLQGDVTGVDRDTITVTFKAPGQPRIGARLNVYRGRRKIGELTLTTAYGQSAAGKFSGAGQPRSGDRVTSAQ